MFLGQGFQKLEHEQDRHTDTHRQTRLNALPVAFAGGKRFIDVGARVLISLMMWLHVKYNYLKIILAFVDVRLK